MNPDNSNNKGNNSAKNLQAGVFGGLGNNNNNKNTSVETQQRQPAGKTKKESPKANNDNKNKLQKQNDKKIQWSTFFEGSRPYFYYTILTATRARSMINLFL